MLWKRGGGGGKGRRHPKIAIRKKTAAAFITDEFFFFFWLKGWRCRIKKFFFSFFPSSCKRNARIIYWPGSLLPSPPPLPPLPVGNCPACVARLECWKRKRIPDPKISPEEAICKGGGEKCSGTVRLRLIVNFDVVRFQYNIE